MFDLITDCMGVFCVVMLVYLFLTLFFWGGALFLAYTSFRI